MEFTDIKLLDENVDLSKIKPFDWDLVIKGRPYYVCRIEGYCHTISWQGGNECRQELWCYPRDKQPTLENLVEYTLKDPIAWGIEYDEIHSTHCKWDECETITGGRSVITRNGTPFYTVFGTRQYSIPKALTLIAKAQDHALDFSQIDFDKKMIGRKVWFNGQPAIIESYIHGQCCVILKPDGIDKFKVPPQFVEEDGEYYEENPKIDCLETGSIWWFRR